MGEPNSILYPSTLHVDKQESAQIRKYVEEKWWPSLCRSALHKPFKSTTTLFEDYWFDEDGVLDVRKVVWRKIIQSLGLLYLYIKDRNDTEDLSNWRVRWATGTKGEPFIHAFATDANSGDAEKEFALHAPKSGWLDYNSELMHLRKMRSAGEHLTIPGDKKRFYGPPPFMNLQSWEIFENVEFGSVSTHGECVISRETQPKILLGTKLLESSLIDNEDWDVVDFDDLGDISDSGRSEGLVDFQKIGRQRAEKKRWFW